MSNKNNKPLLLLTTLLALFSSSAFAVESTSKSCNPIYPLPNNQWRQIFLPCDPGLANTVAEVLGDDMVQSFGQTEPRYSID